MKQGSAGQITPLWAIIVALGIVVIIGVSYPILMSVAGYDLTSMRNALISAGYRVFAQGESIDADTVGGYNVARTATVVIVASDAPANWKAQADVVVSGDADDEINDNVAPNIHMVLSSGNFVISANVIMTDNFTLTGQGASTIFRTKDGRTGYNCSLYAKSREGIEVSDIMFYGNKENQSSGSVHGIYLEDCTRCLIDNSFFINMRNNGVYLYNTSFTRVTNNYGEGNGESNPTTPMGHTITANLCSYLSIEGNTCKDDYDDGIGLGRSTYSQINDNNCSGSLTDEGISLDGCRVIQINDNICEGNTGHGIDVDSLAGYPTRDIKLDSNTCYNNLADGICIFDSSGGTTANITLSDNDCSDNDRGIVVEDGCTDISISGGRVNFNSRHGIDIRETVSGVNIIGVHLRGNSQQLAGNYGGIGLRDTVDDIFGSSNFIRGDGQEYGVYIEAGVTNAAFIGNDLRGAGTTVVSDAAGADFRDNLGWVTENTGTASNVTLDGSGVGAIAHGCDNTPTYANVICQSESYNVRVSSIDATDINIYVRDLDNAVVTADTHDFYWEAKVR